MRMRRLKPDLWLQGFFLILALIYLAAWVAQTARRGNAGDFLATYTAIKIINAGEGRNLYDFTLQTQTQHPIAHLKLPPADLLPYITPPFFALPFLPLGLLPFNWAFAAMTIINLLLTLLTLTLLRANLSGLLTLTWTTLLLAIVSFFPWFVNLMQGQNAVITLLILSGTFLLLKRRRDGWAGSVLALGLYKPQLSVLFFVVLLAKKRRRAVLAYIGVALILLAISYAMVGQTGFDDYIRLTLTDSPLVDGFYGVKYPKMHNWRGFFTLLLGQNYAGLASALTIGASTVSLAALGWAWRGAWRPDTSKFDLQFALLVIVALLVSPHLNTHDLTLWLLVGALGVNAAMVGKTSFTTRRKITALIVLGSVISFLTFPLGEALHLQLTTLFMATVGIILIVVIAQIDDCR